MNAPARIVSAEPSPPYDGDTYGWAVRQAELLRAGRFAEVDLPNVIEEIETVGRSERRSLSSNIERVLVHVIKWDFQPQRRGMSWWLTIMNHRDEALRDLNENPSLRPELENFFERALVRGASQRRCRNEGG